MQRDKENNLRLQNNGWKVMRFWEHQIKKEFNVCVNTILDYISEQKS
jgi:DNA mismatch endonuclease (patch repair protein)